LKVKKGSQEGQKQEEIWSHRPTERGDTFNDHEKLDAVNKKARETTTLPQKQSLVPINLYKWTHFLDDDISCIPLHLHLNFQMQLIYHLI